jgi:chloramphenicol-sensitive protein RarD
MRALMSRQHNPSIPSADHRSGQSGLLAAVGAFVLWGLFPIYLKPLAGVPALEVIAHRIVWCCLLVFAWLAVRGELGLVRAALADPVSRKRLLASATLISINWLIYVWAVTHEHVLDASLGYFINPLVNVLLGVAVLGERLNRAQKTAVALAAAGVLYLAVVAGRPPWIALALAASFGLYGLIRKVVAVDSVPGLATETLLLAPFAVALLAWNEAQGVAALGHSSALVNALLVGSGLVTAIPLVLFAYGARRIPLSTVGLVQYIGPTLQFLIGVLVFHEAFSLSRGIGFAFIWIALAVYAADGLWRSRKASRMLR